MNVTHSLLPGCAPDPMNRIRSPAYPRWVSCTVVQACSEPLRARLHCLAVVVMLPKSASDLPRSARADVGRGSTAQRSSKVQTMAREALIISNRCQRRTCRDNECRSMRCVGSAGRAPVQGIPEPDPLTTQRATCSPPTWRMTDGTWEGFLMGRSWLAAGDSG